MSVTATSPVPHAPGDSRNGVHNGRPEAVTATRLEGYPAGPASVTCAKCGGSIPSGENMLVMHVRHSRLGIAKGASLCMQCMAELVKECRPYYCYHVPWECPGPRGRRTHLDYQHWCDRCGRPFLGALARRYCSDACGELTRASRRDRSRDRDARACETCGDTFTPPRSDGRYCSSACRQKAYRRRKGGG